MKKLEISRLMDDYRDDEFFPEGGSTADVEAVKKLVLAKAAPAKKRRPRFAQVLLAAALAVGCALCVACIGPNLPMQVYHMVTGGSAQIQLDATGQYYTYISLEDVGTPIVLEDGRLWLDLDGGRTDVTDLINEETPYIVTGEDPETGLKSYLIVGGTPEDYGWHVWMEMPLGDYSGGGWNSYTTYCKIDGELVEYNEWRASLPYGEDETIPGELIPKTVNVNKPWFENGDAQLHLWD